MARAAKAYLLLWIASAGRELPTRDVSSRVRLTKTPAEYSAVRESRRDQPYEAMLASGQTRWSVGDRVRVYRKRNGGCGLLEEPDEDHLELSNVDPRDYDVDYYARQFRQTFACRFACAFSPGDYEAVFADSDQMTLFMPRADVDTYCARKESTGRSVKLRPSRGIATGCELHGHAGYVARQA